jgi:hypothetical protein
MVDGQNHVRSKCDEKNLGGSDEISPKFWQELACFSAISPIAPNILRNFPIWAKYFVRAVTFGKTLTILWRILGKLRLR